MTKYIRVGASAFALIMAVTVVAWLSGHDALGAGTFEVCGSAGPTDTTPGAIRGTASRSITGAASSEIRLVRSPSCVSPDAAAAGAAARKPIKMVPSALIPLSMSRCVINS